VLSARAHLIAVLLVVLDGCSVGPAYHRPEMPPPTAWRNAAPNENTDWPRVEWWQDFGSSQLDSFMAQAKSSNDDIGAAVARVLEADAQVRVAGSALLPTIDLGASATRQRTVAVTGGRTPIYNEFSPQLTASYELDFWGKNRAIRNAAVFAAQASRYDRDTIALTVYTSVALTYFQALEANDRLLVAQDDLANAQHILDGLELEQNVGVATALDVAQQATTVATVNATIPPLTQQLQQNIDALAILVGQSPEAVKVELESSLDQLKPPAVIAGIPSELLVRRPDVAEAEAQLREANANIVAARAAFFPSFDLTASGGFASTVLMNLLTHDNLIFGVGASATQTIFDFGARSGQLAFERARYSELLSDYHKTVLTAFGNVEDALVAVQQTAEEQVRQQDAVDKASRAFEFAQLQMRAGTTNILTELNTEIALFTAKDALVQVKFLHLQALVELYQALGGGWRQEPAT
jgi:NodT family efflux transporter outer membrane factor (OMF) lipoprotein